MRSGRQHCCSSCSRTAATGVLPLSLAACVALLFIVAAHMHIASAAPWDLATYKLCAQRRLAGMRDNASGAAYSPATHTLWVLGGRRSETKRLFEYNAKNGNYIRQVELVNQIDAEALTWTGSDGSGGGGSRNASTKAAASGAAGAVTSQLHSLTMAEEDHKDGGLVTLDVRPGE